VNGVYRPTWHIILTSLSRQSITLVNKKLVQYRLTLYSILIDLLNAMQVCKVVELFLLATIRLVSLLGGTLIFGWLKCQFSVMWRNLFTISDNSVVYQSAPVVDLCCRDSSLSVTQFAPRPTVEGPFVEHSLASLWTRFLTNRLTQTITQFGSVFRSCFRCLPRRLTDVEWLFHSNNSNYNSSHFWLFLRTPSIGWRLVTLHTKQVIDWLTCYHANNQLILHQCSIMSTDL